MSTVKKERNSSIELLKIFAIFLIVICHTVKSVTLDGLYVAPPSTDYLIDLSHATENLSQLILSMLRYCGTLGNTIFFVCSCRFLTDSKSFSKKKVLNMLADIWLISVIFLGITYFIRGGDINAKLLIRQFFPTVFANNWYLTCYLLFYPVHPLLNHIIEKLDKKHLLRLTAVMFILYVGFNFIGNFFFNSTLILWTAIYFGVAYTKKYLPAFCASTKSNVILLVLGVLGYFGLVAITNLLGLKIAFFENKLLYWDRLCSPFCIMIAFALLNLACKNTFNSKPVNFVSSLSLLIYITHENMLVRNYFRPLLWQYVYRNFGYEHILALTSVLVIIVFLFGLLASIIYRFTFQKLAARLCNYFYPVIAKAYRKIEEKILKAR
ncbi:MAG: acyltransferase family protein [Clostridia bacterium]|nr:acyltransferase family protein [Clostridia bacterium]